MKKQYITFIILLAMVGHTALLLGQGRPSCNQGAQQSQLPDSSRVFLPDSCIFSGHFVAVGSNDPNEIVGPTGFQRSSLDSTRWISASQRLAYTIYFENDPLLASAPAQRVEIRMPIPPLMNASSLAIGGFGFNNREFAVEGTHSSYQQRLDLRATAGLYVDVVAGLDLLRNEIVWVFQSVDTATGLPPTGLYQGFLPINDATHAGEGHVSFTIMPQTSRCHTGDTLSAQASIVFDINPAIATNRWCNTLDAAAPTSQLTVISLPGNDSILFAGADDEGGCGLRQYRLFRSENGGAYHPMGTHVSSTTASTTSGVEYRYYCLAEDHVGNLEVKDSADAQHGAANILLALQAYPAQGGTVSGGGIMTAGSSATITAAPATGYHFVRWAHNGITLSTSATHQFSTEEDMELTAYFEPNLYTLTLQQAAGLTLSVSSLRQGPLSNGSTIAHFDTLVVDYRMQPCHQLGSLTLNGAALLNGMRHIVAGDVEILAATQLESHPGTDIQVACESYTWIDNETYTASTSSPQYHLATAEGCDSLVTLHLTIGHATHDTIAATIQQGETYGDNGFNESEPGIYTLNYLSQEGCDSTVTLVLSVNPLGIDVVELSSDLIRIRPNPTKGRIRVSWQGADAECIDIYDMLGRKVLHAAYQGGEVHLDLSDQPSGNYLLIVTTPNGVAVRKIIKR